MIQDANDTIGQLVGGSGGRWCPETAYLLESFWKDLVKLTIGRDTRPSEKVIDIALKSISLDDYSQLNMEKLFECLKPWEQVGKSNNLRRRNSRRKIREETIRRIIIIIE